MKKLVLNMILAYQRHISPLKPPSCRFHPSCSAYSYEAISRFGLRKGGILAGKRLLKCHPFYKQNTMVCDPVPERWKGK